MSYLDHDQNEEFEYSGLTINGFAMVFFTFILIPLLMLLTITRWGETNLAICIPVMIVLAFLFVMGCVGYFTQEPNEARVMIFFGRYCGTSRRVGYYWVNPFMNRRKLSLRLCNMDIDPIKVNDKVGNPVLIGMVLVWRIKDTYRAVFDIDPGSSLDRFVRIQSDAALREVTGHYAYDTEGANSGELTLRDGGSEINELLERKINDRLDMAGIEVVEARINYLAYAPEIAAVMLRRQQASAIISAREKIVEGAVSMVDMALRHIEQSGMVTLDNERKAAMVSNLLVVLCADEAATPVINAGN